MPRLSVYFIRASMIYILLGFTIGSLMLANKGILFSPFVWSLLSLHIEFAFIGWMIQLAMGVAFWILPRFPKGAPRGDERLSWLAFLLINAGIVAVVLSVPLGLQVLVLLARTLEILAFILFVVGNWKRIRPSDF